MPQRGVKAAGNGGDLHKGLTAEIKGDTQLVNFPLGMDDLGQAGRLGGGRSREPGAFFVPSHLPHNISTTLMATQVSWERA